VKRKRSSIAMIMHKLVSTGLLATLFASFTVIDAQFPICYICGDADATFNPDVLLGEPPDTATCSQVNEAGLAGVITAAECTSLIVDFGVSELCECSNVAAPATTPVAAPVSVPVSVPVPVPVPAPVPVPVPVPDPVSAPVQVPVPVGLPVSTPMSSPEAAPVAPVAGGMGMKDNQQMAMGMGNAGNMGGMGMAALLRHAQN
jgi:hypothetical protein